MQLDELRRVREAERDTDSLQPLGDDFYVEVGEYLDELRERRDALAAESTDPFADSEVREVADELKTATRIVESLYERRVGKIVKLASFAAADMHAETEGLTSEEHALFEAIVADIRENRQEVLDILEDDGERGTELLAPSEDDLARGSPHEKGDEAEDPAPIEETASRSSEPGPGSDPDSDPDLQNPPAADPDPTDDHADDDAVERTTVRITEDIGEIVGIDEHAYELVADDVVSLPTDNARPLIERGVADDLE